MLQPVQYFGGTSITDHSVKLLPCKSFQELVDFLKVALPVDCTRERFHIVRKDAKSHADPAVREKQTEQLNLWKWTRFLLAGVYGQDGCSRKLKNVTGACLVTIDIDTTADALSILKRPLKADLNCNFFLHHSISSLPDAPRLRLIVDIEPCSVEEHKRAVYCIRDRIGLRGKSNPESLDPSRPMFHPAIFSGETEPPTIDSEVKSAPLPRSEFKDYPIALSAAADGETDTAAEGFDLLSLDRLTRPPIKRCTIERAREMLAKISPDVDYHEWLSVAMALRHQFGSDRLTNQAAQDLFFEWSSDGVKFKDFPDILSKWRSINNDDLNRQLITIRSVIQKAQENGWDSTDASDKALAEFRTMLTETIVPSDVYKVIRQIVDDPFLLPSAEGTLRAEALQRYKLHGLLSTTMADVKAEFEKARKAANLEKRKAARPEDAQPWASRYIYCSTGDKFISIQTYASTSFAAFNHKHLKDAKDAGITVQPSDYTLCTAAAPVVHDSGYRPDIDDLYYKAPNGERYFNTYRRDYPEASETHAQHALDLVRFHLRHVLCGGDERTAEILLSWMAYIVSNAGKKIKWCPLLIGNDGTGKSLVSVWLAAALGRSNVRSISNDTLNQKWTEWFGSAQVLVFDETLVSDSRKDVMEKLKTLVTEEQVSINTRFENTSDVLNITNMIFSSNHTAALPLSPTDRRFFVIKCAYRDADEVLSQHGSDYFTRCHQLREDPAYAAGLRYALLHMVPRHPEFDPVRNAPDTPFRQEVIEHSGSEVEFIIRRLIEEQRSPLITRFVLCSRETLRLVREETSMRGVSPRQIANALARLQFTGRTIPDLIHGTRRPLWVHSSWNEEFDGSAVERLRSSVNEHAINELGES